MATTTTSRNHSLSVFLVNKDVRAIATVYEDIDLAKDTTKMKYQQAYLSGVSLPKNAVIHKTMDQDIKVSDYVIVPTDTRLGMTVTKVVAVDVEIDLDSGADCHWVMGTVDTTGFETVRQWEEKVIVAIKAADGQKQREILGADLVASMGDSIPKLRMLSISEDAPQPAQED